MSVIASSSATVAIANGNSNNSSAPSKRRSGTFRVLAEDCSQFTLCDDEIDSDYHQVLTNCERYTIGMDPMLDEPLINHSNTINDYLHDRVTKDTLKRGSYMPNHDKEISRLTDEVEIDGDSAASDELDLLPPLPTCSSNSGRKFPKWNVKLPNWLKLCRNPRIPIKCIIM